MESFPKKEREPFKAISKAVPKASSNLKADFKTIMQLKISLRKLSGKSLEGFAKKYGISYRDTSEIESKAISTYTS